MAEALIFMAGAGFGACFVAGCGYLALLFIFRNP